MADESIQVLHVDDEPEFAELTATFLEREHSQFTVETAQSASAGLDRLDEDVDCIVSDYDMPGTDGIDFLETVREEYPDLPFVLFTGKGSEEVASEAIAAGVTDYLQKEGGSSQYAVLANRIENAVTQYDAERRASERKRELERQNESLEKFASIVGHDLRTPLSVAQGRLELLRENCDSPELDEIERALDRTSTLLETLLTLARTGQSITETTWVDLDSIARGAWRNVDTTEMTLVVDGNCEIDADPDRLRQLFENLFENSISHAESAVTVTVGSLEVIPMTTRATDNTYKGFYVSDDGPGIPEDVRGDVLDWGFTTTRDGTGFGLAIVEGIAQAHGWEITVTDSHHGGARFEFTGQEFRQPGDL